MSAVLPGPGALGADVAAVIEPAPGGRASSAASIGGAVGIDHVNALFPYTHEREMVELLGRTVVAAIA